MHRQITTKVKVRNAGRVNNSGASTTFQLTVPAWVTWELGLECGEEMQVDIDPKTSAIIYTPTATHRRPM